MELLIPSNFEVLGLIGKGSQAVVVKVKNTVTAVISCLKVYKISNERDANEALNEMAMLSRISHPNVIQCLAAGKIGQDAFVEMEYCRFGTLSRIMKQEMGTNTICAVLCQILLGLRVLHKRHILHRDIKPQNILLWQEDGQFILKLSDLGMSK